MFGPIDKVSLEPFDEIADRDQLATWLHHDHVVRWWGDPDDRLKECLARPVGGGHAVIKADGAAVGYIRWQRINREELAEAGLTEIPDGAVDIDIMIGMPAYIGCGVGPRALSELIDKLLADPTIPLVGLGTSVENVSAIRAFEKVGFRRLREFDDPLYGRCVVMVVTANGG